jgi:DNA-binding transcriptional ArsR family regulator
MSSEIQLTVRLSDLAVTFAALGDPRRLSILERLHDADKLSVSVLCDGMGVSRQAVSKHLKTLSAAKLVTARKSGRETHYSLERERLDDAKSYLIEIGQKWDDALGRLRTFVENSE